MHFLSQKSSPRMEFHISRRVRDRYNFDESLFAQSGNVIFSNFNAARIFSQKINAKRDLIRFPEQTVKAGQINAMGLIDEILHYIFHQYRSQKNPEVMEKALSWLYTKMGRAAVDKVLYFFADEFPPLRVYRRDLDLDSYFDGETEGISNKLVLLEELILLWLTNTNPAFSPYLELFDDQRLETTTKYLDLIFNLQDFFESQPGFGPDNLSLFTLLREPALNSPYSLAGQLKFIREHWSLLLGKYLHQLLSSLDFIKEEEKPSFTGPGPSRVYKFSEADSFAEEKFSPDQDWMPRLVLLAKNAYVWLDQLSKEYHQMITRLDQVPDKELDKLSQWGFTGMWLIGIWERSPASQRIKQLCGNPDAVASAYSIYDYIIAETLGGDEAYNNLKTRAWQRGIRLAADMVPNHVGIYSKWVIEHPDWFISLDYSPFPTYSFNGENLSQDERVGIYLEDHYYSREDAAVVFKRVDHWTGTEKLIFHGNDGTSMPWNDTAQLNYLIPEVRESVVQTIIHVARKFPIIRFDAAMTLAKKHFQRLWYPQPGTGGDIPSRSEFGLSQELFDLAMPAEFWREVVDRVTQEVPDTLLLAEAFWMMEGYFVRTLGMHRVYNSAFMNMLRDEKNAQYRQLIKNTLEFDPEILRRYVNFMNNPDEKTALEQFGKDDKYFGICTMMVTMPGLPMFGHGQIEGYHEKYGMEYYRAYWDEQPDSYLVNRHRREIFPLLHRRYLFAEVDNFYLYDFYSPEGLIEQNIFAYSNRIGDPGSNACQRALVVYHNRWDEIRGWIKTSVPFKVNKQPSDTLFHTDLGNGLGLKNEANVFTIFKDHINGLEYIRSNRQIHNDGLYIELGAYKYQVFLDFREVVDNEWRQFAQLEEHLNGRGVPDIEEAFKEILLQSLHYPFKEIVNPGFFHYLIENRQLPAKQVSRNLVSVITEAEAKTTYLFQGINELSSSPIENEPLVNEIGRKLEIILKISNFPVQFPLPRSRNYRSATNFMLDGLENHFALEMGDSLTWGILFSWLFTHNLGKVLPDSGYEERGRKLIDDWLLRKIIAETLQNLGIDEGIAMDAVFCIKALVRFQNWNQIQIPKRKRPLKIMETWLADEDIQRYIKINHFQGVTWINKEAMESLLRWMLIIGTIQIINKNSASPVGENNQAIPVEIVEIYKIIRTLFEALNKSEYRVDKLLAEIK